MRQIIRKGICAALALACLTQSVGAVDWGLWYGRGAGQPPEGNESVETLLPYDTYFMADPSKKILYLTFDCGYENGYTASILDTLKRHHVPAAFFLLGGYIDSAPELTKRMVNEGHIVGNHSTNHPNMTRVSKERFDNELTTLENKYTALVGRRLDPYFRPPEGSYTHENLTWAQALGYKTILWSVAYMDWDENAQPSVQSALQTVRSRTHNGAIILLHAVSRTNAAILDDLISGWEAEGYTFAALSALPGSANPTVNALPNTSSFAIDGKAVTLTAFYINGETHVKLRDLAAALVGTSKAFSITYDKSTETVWLASGSYTPNGGELGGSANFAAPQAARSQQTVTWENGTALTAYSILGENYVNLQEFLQKTNICTSYDSSTKTISLLTTES